jgi:hypothetical protein
MALIGKGVQMPSGLSAAEVDGRRLLKGSDEFRPARDEGWEGVGVVRGC